MTRVAALAALLLSACADSYTTRQGWLVEYDNAIGLNHEDKLDHAAKLSAIIDVTAFAIEHETGDNARHVFEDHAIVWRYNLGVVGLTDDSEYNGFYRPPDLIEINWLSDCASDRADVHELIHVYMCEALYCDGAHNDPLWIIDPRMGSLLRGLFCLNDNRIAD